jgi:hypothetical protein
MLGVTILVTYLKRKINEDQAFVLAIRRCEDVDQSLLAASTAQSTMDALDIDANAFTRRTSV